MAPILLFSDVDGTLLDGRGCYAVSYRALEDFANRILVVLASSRTVLELSRNQRDLGITGPVVAENGAVVAFPWDDRLQGVGPREVIDDRAWCVIALGVAADLVRSAVQQAAETLGVRYVDQRDVEATLGRRRSILMRPVAGASWDSLDALAVRLRGEGFVVSSGGSWLAVTGGVEKGDGARVVRTQLDRLGVRYAGVAAVGDAENDVSLLLAAERRFTMRRDDGSWHAALRDLPSSERVLTAGVAGWRDVLHRLTALQEA
ncbi:MAG: HAD hydrolase family protein [Gemmatimonadaceae bacterium]|nr:HAD hydrolase family protein [Gemmatimonadaceae bacterium]